MKNCGSSSVGRASASQAEGREFEPRLPLSIRAPRPDFLIITGVSDRIPKHFDLGGQIAPIPQLRRSV